MQINERTPIIHIHLSKATSAAKKIIRKRKKQSTSITDTVEKQLLQKRKQIAEAEVERT